jgi:ABC-type sugar transport system permease subunit
MYTTSFRYHNFGYGATIAVAVFLLAAVVAVVNLAALRRFRGV